MRSWTRLGEIITAGLFLMNIKSLIFLVSARLSDKARLARPKRHSPFSLMMSMKVAPLGHGHCEPAARTVTIPLTGPCCQLALLGRKAALLADSAAFQLLILISNGQRAVIVNSP